MAALDAIDVVRHLTVIEGGRASSGDWRLEEAQAELTARRAEEQRMADQLFPLLQQAKLIARRQGSAEFRVIATIEALLNRHARRWQDDGGDAA